MTTDFTTRSAYEAKTHELMSRVRAEATNSADVIVANVFQAMWSSSLTVERISKIGEAMYGFSGLDIQEVVTRLARKRILRSRTHSGERLYEVNY